MVSSTWAYSLPVKLDVMPQKTVSAMICLIIQAFFCRGKTSVKPPSEESSSELQHLSEASKPPCIWQKIFSVVSNIPYDSTGNTCIFGIYPLHGAVLCSLIIVLSQLVNFPVFLFKLLNNLRLTLLLKESYITFETQVLYLLVSTNSICCVWEKMFFVGFEAALPAL